MAFTPAPSSANPHHVQVAAQSSSAEFKTPPKGIHFGSQPIESHKTPLTRKESEPEEESYPISDYCSSDEEDEVGRSLPRNDTDPLTHLPRRIDRRRPSPTGPRGRR